MSGGLAGPVSGGPGSGGLGSDGSGLDWPGLMRAGLHGLRLCPDQFWRLTPIELMVMLGRDGGQGPISRDRLNDLLRDFPDSDAGDRDG